MISVSGCLDNNESVGCPEDAMVCPDGTTVSRIGPDCEFEKCPAQEQTEETQTNIIYVSIVKGEFDPSEITAGIGTTIVWKNDDNKPHAVGGAQLGGGSGTLQAGESWNYTVNRAQTYRFYDTFYYFQGRIYVE